MKKTILLLTFIFSHIFLFSQNIANKNEVEYLALKYINSELAIDDTIVFSIKKTKLFDYNNHKSYYVVNFNPTGHVVMSAYKFYEPILSYSLLHNFSFDPNNFFLNAYDYIIDSLYNNKIENTKYSLKWEFLETEKLGKKDTRDDYLLTTLWGQNSNNENLCGNNEDPNYGAYNKFVPKMGKCGCGHCTAGCGSLAMAQFIRFWEYPPYSRKRIYNYNLMPNELIGVSAPEQIDEIAHLISDCGKFCDMVYCVAFNEDCASLTTLDKIKGAFKRPLNYSHDIEKKKYKNYDTDEAWFNMLREELDFNRPIIYRGNKTNNSVKKGHVFICDGYDTDENNKFHFNTGNKAMAWYHIPEDDYNVFQMQVLIKVYPDVMYSCNSVIDLGVWYEENNKYEPMLDQPWARTVLTATTNYPENFRTVYDGENVNMHAYNSVVLRQGFSVQQGGNFHAYLTDCPEQKTPKNKNITDNSNNAVNQKIDKITNLQISPNPASNTISISYFLPQETDYSIEIYDIFGKKLKQLEQGNKKEGNYQFYINLSFLQNGVYFYVLKTSQGVVSEKIVKI